MARTSWPLSELPLSFYETIAMVLILLNVGWDHFSPAHAQALTKEVCCDGAFSYTQWQPSIAHRSVLHSTMLEGNYLRLAQTSTEGNQEPVPPPTKGHRVRPSQRTAKSAGTVASHLPWH